VAVRIPRKQQNIALPLVIPLDMEMLDIVAQRSPQRALAERITLDKHSCPCSKPGNAEQV